MFSFCTNDAELGPVSLCRPFDFTVTFENAILSVLPTSVFLSCAVVYGLKQKKIGLWTASRRSALVLVASLLLTIANVLSLLSWFTINVQLPSTAVHLVSAALSLSLVASILEFLVNLTTFATPAVTFYISLYQFVSLILDTARVRTFVVAGSASTSTFFLSSLLAQFICRFVAFLSLNIPRRGSDNQLSEDAGFFSHLFILWALPLMWKGRQGELSIEDLPELHPGMSSTDLYRRFDLVWKREITKHPRRPLLIRALFRTFYGTFLGAVLPAILRALGQAVQPLLVNATINFIDSYSSTSPQPGQWGWALAGAYAVIYFGMSAATGLYFYYNARTGAYIRGAMIEAIFRKTLDLDAGSVGEAGGGDPMNLMSTDIERMTVHIDPFHQIWSSVIILIIGLYILYDQLGVSFVAAVIVTVFVMLAAPVLSRNIGDIETRISALCDKRVRLISGILRQIKGVKLSAFEPELVRKVKEARTNELRARKEFWDRFAIVVCLTNTTMNILSLFTLGTYAIVSYLTHGEPLTTARLFTAYTVLSVISASLFNMGQYLPGVIGAYTSVKRIEAYLNSPESKRDSLSTSDVVDRQIFSLEKVLSPLDVLQGQALSSTLGIRLMFKKASIGWEEKVVLTNVNAIIRMRQLTMVIGRVASGKSTFLASLLQEARLTSGCILYPWRRGAIAYCSQTPWLQSSISISKNILFTSRLDKEWYDRVITACALQADFQDIEGGDTALARGLSGGQRARVALARAVYSRNEVIVLDDVFAALDGPTSSAVFAALFGLNGLLLGKTVVLATNQATHLRHADWIIALENCSVAEQGTYASLYDSEGLSGSLLKNGITGSSHFADAPQLRHVVDKTIQESEQSEEGAEDIDSMPALDPASRQTYLHYIHSVGWHRICIYVLLLFITIAIQTVTPVYLQIWSSYNDSLSGTSGSANSLAIYLGGYAAFEVAYSIALTILFYYVIMAVSLRASANLHLGAFAAVMKAPMEFFDSTQVGQIISRFSQDIFIVDDLFPIALYDWGYQGMRVVGSAILMIASVPYLAAVVAAVVGIAYFVQKFYLATSKRLRRLDLGSKSPLYTLFQETIDFNGLLTIRAASAEAHFERTNTSLLSRSQKPFYLTNILSAWLASTIGLMTALVNTAIVVLAVATRYHTNAGLLAAGLTQAVALQDVISLLLISWTQMEISAVAIERNMDYSKLKSEEQDASSNHREPGTGWPTKGEVKFEKVVARYTKSAQPALKGISFHADAGCKLAICGRTGSGKSTVLLALLRALRVEGGILIDGVDVTNVPRGFLRRGVTVVAQDPFVLDETVRGNIDVAGLKTDEEVWAALEAVQLKPTISGLEGQLDHELRSSGHELSQGQMQLLVLARALLRGNKIVVLDEATGNLDVETDKLIQRVIRTAFSDFTVITIAHRMGTIIDYDQVIVLERGSVVETGKPSELLGDEGTMFSQLCRAQDDERS